MRSEFVKSGYRVIGPNTADGALHSWYFPSEEDANRFAKDLAISTDQEIEVCKFVSCWRSVIPTEQVLATDLEK